MFPLLRRDSCWPCSAAGGAMPFPCMGRAGRTHFKQLLNSPQEAFWLGVVISHNLWWVVLWLSSFPKSGQTRFHNQSNILCEHKLDRSTHRQNPCQTLPGTWFFKGANPLVGNTTWILQEGTRSFNIWELFVGTLCSHLHFNHWMSPTDSPVISMRWN